MSTHLSKVTTKAAVPPPPDIKDADSVAHLYPIPQAKYEEVTVNAEIFMKTLENLHISIGTKFMVPTLGGKSLDLHRLFVEVTSRGGLEKVIRDRKWRDVIAAFSFPSTITNASFVLRKYYISLLHHYEQVYFFRIQGSTISAAASVPAESSATASTEVQVQAARQPAQEKDATKNQIPVSSMLSVGCSVTGTIDGKFDNGYLVTADFGLNKLKGILYHVPVELPESRSLTPAVPRRRKRKRSRMTSKDPSHPKPNRSGYNFFFAEQCANLPEDCGEENTISRKIGYLWSKLSEAEKEVYQEKGLKDKERYRREMLEYKKSLNPSKRQ
eukprot:TRINITY_DN3879_c0_g2_i1.p1 TRINITY_DN3879_c0_g2~~TRINITY_DN3879_c0_g2_i1.p1  ORF type:complete len:328 (-),score=55.18 TRINITY_DN3879_c0_g2_i1:22-1005(-)